MAHWGERGPLGWLVLTVVFALLGLVAGIFVVAALR